MKKFFPLFLLAVIFPTYSYAVTLSVFAPTSSTEINEPVRVDVALDTQKDDINAIQGTIIFPAANFTLQSISDGDSPISFWVTSPAETASGTVSFAGIIPDGFQGAASSVISLWLLPTAPGSTTVSLEDVSVLKNDGNASPATTTLGSAAIMIAPTIASGTPVNPASTISPQPFTPVIASNPSIYNGQYFLVFSTTDKGSGIDHYEVMEVSTEGGGSPTSTIGSTGWRVATSPYLLEDQSLSSNIYVRAIDHAGNFIVVEIPAEHPEAAVMRRRNQAVIFAAAVIVIAILLGWWLWRRIRRRRRE